MARYILLLDRPRGGQLAVRFSQSSSPLLKLKFGHIYKRGRVWALFVKFFLFSFVASCLCSLLINTTCSSSTGYALLEKCLKAPVKAPVAGAFWYRFFEPVPRKWYQRLKPLVGKLTGI